MTSGGALCPASSDTDNPAGKALFNTDYTLEVNGASVTDCSAFNYLSGPNTLRITAAADSVAESNEPFQLEIDDGNSEFFHIGFTLINGPRPAATPPPAATPAGDENLTSVSAAWLTRFGRTVAAQVIDAVDARLNQARSASVEDRSQLEIRLGGQVMEMNPNNRQDITERQTDDSENFGAQSETWSIYGDRTRMLREDGSLRTLAVSALPADLSFNYASGDSSSGIQSVWGSGSVSDFEGSDGETQVDGKVSTLMLGTDVTEADRTVGVMLSHSKGKGDYEQGQGGANNQLRSTMTGFYAYGSQEVNDRLSLWGIAGIGSGELTVSHAGGTSKPQSDFWLVAGGLRKSLLDVAGGPQVSMVADVMAVSASASAADGVIGKVETDVSRFRLGVESVWSAAQSGSGLLKPKIRVDVRHDGGDAERGVGADVEAGVNWIDRDRGIEAEFKAKALVAHEVKGVRQRTISSSVTWGPKPGAERGAKFSLTGSIRPAGEVDDLMGGNSFARSAPDFNIGLPRDGLTEKWHATVGYEFSVNRFTSVPHVGLGKTDGLHEYSVGWRLTPTGAHNDSLYLRVGAKRRETVQGKPKDSYGLQIGTQW